MTSATAIETIVLVIVRCPWRGHILPVSVPQGTQVRGYCRSCGREFVSTMG
jgi:hypothetical protein